MSGRRFMSIALAEEVLGELLRRRPEGQWLRVATDPIPEDARVVRVWYSPVHGCWFVAFESAAFPEVPDGEEIPVIERAPRIEARMFPEEAR